MVSADRATPDNNGNSIFGSFTQQTNDDDSLFGASSSGASFDDGYSNTSNSIFDTGGDDDYYSDFTYFPANGHSIGLFLIGLVSSLLSIAGSCIILYLVISDQRTTELYHRLLLGLSLSDLLMTSTLVLQPLLVPRDTNYVFAIGTQGTCQFLGFGYLFFIASYCYNFLLGIYFLATVRYHVPQTTISNYMEPYGHIIAFTMPIGIGISALYFDMLNVNPFLGVCSLFPPNHECTWKDGVECENPKAYNVLNSVLDFYALGLAASGLICTGLVYWTVKRVLWIAPVVSGAAAGAGATSTSSGATMMVTTNNINNNNNKNSTIRTAPPSSDAAYDDYDDYDDDDDDLEGNITNHSATSFNDRTNHIHLHPNHAVVAATSSSTMTHHQHHVNNSINNNNIADTTAQQKRTHSIAMQAVWYTAAYFVGILVVLGANITSGIYLDGSDPDASLDALNSPIYYFVLVLIWCLFPLQGFLNCLVYIRPRLVRWKHHYGGDTASWWFAFQKVLSKEVPPRWGAPTASIENNNNGATKGGSSSNNNSRGFSKLSRMFWGTSKNNKSSASKKGSSSGEKKSHEEEERQRRQKEAEFYGRLKGGSSSGSSASGSGNNYGGSRGGSFGRISSGGGSSKLSSRLSIPSLSVIEEVEIEESARHLHEVTSGSESKTSEESSSMVPHSPHPVEKQVQLTTRTMMTTPPEEVFLEEDEENSSELRQPQQQQKQLAPSISIPQEMMAEVDSLENNERPAVPSSSSFRQRDEEGKEEIESSSPLDTAPQEQILSAPAPLPLPITTTRITGTTPESDTSSSSTSFWKTRSPSISSVEDEKLRVAIAASALSTKEQEQNRNDSASSSPSFWRKSASSSSAAVTPVIMTTTTTTKKNKNDKVNDETSQFIRIQPDGSLVRTSSVCSILTES